MTWTIGGLFIMAFVLIGAFSALLHYVSPALLITAKMARVDGITAQALMSMRRKRLPVERIVLPYIAASKSGVPIPLETLEVHSIAGGNVDRVVAALISADRASIPLTFNDAAAIDLAGRDVMEEVKRSLG